jgi:AraC-like DNA-binding protein
VLLVRRLQDPFTLFRLGRAGIQNLILLSIQDLEKELGRALANAEEGGAASLVTRFLSPYLPRRELRMTYLAMDSVYRRWSAEDMAREVGLTRPFISERLKTFGLPSLGHFLLWAKLFHAGHWLEEPGRTGESVGRQLEYSSGAAFRRALKHYTGETPTSVREGGGLRLVMRRFLLRPQLSDGGPRMTVA